VNDARESGDFLARMATASHRRLDRAIATVPERELARRIAALPAPPAPRFTRDAFHLIAEVKRRSPAAGRLAGEALQPAAQARLYAEGGAVAVSVLTEPGEFDGDLAHLTEVAATLPSLPVMRKDFLVGTYQVLEARAAGAAGVLVIAAMLDPEQVEAMIGCAVGLGMFVLVEVFDRADLERCVPAALAAAATEAGRGRVLLGVNCRDLRTLQVDFARFAALAPRLPAALPWVAESGIEGPAQAAEVARLGYGLALVGTALMRSGDPRAAAQAILAAGRKALNTRDPP
jgi:indole-3-glycerol phosphate synthase